MPSVSLDLIKTTALSQITTLAMRLLPQGQRRGDWWVARCPWRDDRTPSLHLSLTTGNFKDWAANDVDRGGTIIDLVMKLDGCDLNTAADSLAALLGLTADASPRQRPPEPPSCASCRHRWERWRGHDYCTAVTLPGLGEPMPCRIARRSGWACGPRGALHCPRDSQGYAQAASDIGAS